MEKKKGSLLHNWNVSHRDYKGLIMSLKNVAAWKKNPNRNEKCEIPVNIKLETCLPRLYVVPRNESWSACCCFSQSCTAVLCSACFSVAQRSVQLTWWPWTGLWLTSVLKNRSYCKICFVILFPLGFGFSFLFLHHLYVSFCKIFRCSNKVAPGFQLRVELYSTCVVEDFAPGIPGPRRTRRLGGSLGCTSGKKIRAAFESATIFRSKLSGEEAETGAWPTASSPHPASVWGAQLPLEKHTRFHQINI